MVFTKETEIGHQAEGCFTVDSETTAKDFMVLWHNRLIVSQINNCRVEFLTEKPTNIQEIKAKN